MIIKKRDFYDGSTAVTARFISGKLNVDVTKIYWSYQNKKLAELF